MKDNGKTQMLFLYDQTIKIWEVLCKLHSELWEITCDEYMALLSSEIEKIEELVNEKKVIIEEVNSLNQSREELISEINHILNTEHIKKASDLIHVFKNFEDKSHQSTLQKLNLLLIEIIEKIQEQNKKNQMFINKAIDSLEDMKLAGPTKKNFKTYNQSGKTAPVSTNR